MMKIEFFTTHRPTTGWLPVAIDTPLNGATTTSFFYHFVSCVPFGKHGTSLSPALAGGQTVAHCQKPFYCTPKCAAQAPASTPARRRRVVRLVVMCVAEYQTQNIPSWHWHSSRARIPEVFKQDKTTTAQVPRIRGLHCSAFTRQHRRQRRRRQQSEKKEYILHYNAIYFTPSCSAEVTFASPGMRV